ncbi:MAG: gliding motility-associated C-terminal domain-containing protein [Bacteroidales bacterium]|nr:gliding motility-associated C-terminal domain-containing protein [Bacteroidales bacterium]
MKKIFILILLLTGILYAKAQVVSISGPSEACKGEEITLTANGAFKPDFILPKCDNDTVYGPYNIGFDFNFYGKKKTEFYIANNGFISFSPGQPKGYVKYTYPQIPTTNPNVPKDCIMGPWQNWNYKPNSETGVISYTNLGTSPNKKLIVSWCSILMDTDTTHVTFQIVLNENGIIENHIVKKLKAKPSSSVWCKYGYQGVHNSGGTKAAAIHNNEQWEDVESSYKYTYSGGNYEWATEDYSPEPVTTDGIQWYKDGEPFATGQSITFTADELGTSIYSFQADLCCCGHVTAADFPLLVKPIPTADFSFDIPCYQVATHFTDLSSPASGGYSITGWDWDFGDGGTSTDQNPDYIFVNQGDQIVRLVVTQDNFCTDTIFKHVWVSPFPDDAGNISGPTDVCQKETHSYSVPEIDSADSYVWEIPADITIVSQNENEIELKFEVTSMSGVISVYGVNDCGNGEASSLSINVNPIPLPAGEITGVSPVVKGQTGVPYSVETIPYADSYEWTVPTGATIASGAGTKSITVDFSMSAVSGYVTVKGVNDCGDGNSSSFTVVVGNLPGPAGDIIGSDSVCINNDFIYEVDDIIQADTYIWTVPSGASIISGENTKKITVHFSPSAINGKITVKGHNSYGVGEKSELNIFVSDLPEAAEPIQGKDKVCNGDISVNYYVPEINRAEYYDWTLPAGVNIISGDSTNNITVNISLSATSGDIIVKAVNYCGSGEEAILPLTVNPLPTASLSGNTEICKNDTAVLEINLTGTPPWQVKYSDGTNSNTISNINDSPLYVNVTPDITSTYTVEEVTDNNTCSNSGTGSFTVTVHELPTANLSGNNSICYGSTSLLTVELTGASPWEIIYSDGDTSITKSNITNSTYSFSVKPEATTTYYITDVLDANLCKNTGIGTATIEVNPIPVASILSDSTTCLNATLTFHDNSTVVTGNINSWFWNFDESGATSYDKNPQYTFESTGLHNISLSVETDKGCTNTTSKSLMVFPNPEVNINFNNGCIIFNTTDTLDAGDFYSEYLWDDGSINRFRIIDSYGEYSVTVTDTNGCSASGNIKVKQCPGKLWIPNAFTPNSDGKNDNFKIFGSLEGVSKFKLSIFDKWGKLLYSTDNIYEGWDGKSNGQLCPAGVYIWVIYYTEQGTGEGEKTLKGHVTLLR